MRRDSRSKQGGKKRVGRGVKSKRLPLLSAKRDVVASINKFTSLSHASLKSYLIMRVKWGRHGRVLPRAAVEQNKDGAKCVYLFYFQ